MREPTVAQWAPTGAEVCRPVAGQPRSRNASQDPSGALHESCGVVAIATQNAEPARLAFFALYALQHRGQESAGICTADGESLRNLTGMGLVSQVFHERDLSKLGGWLSIGHTRYSTTGSSRVENAQPFVVGSRPSSRQGPYLGS